MNILLPQTILKYWLFALAASCTAFAQDTAKNTRPWDNNPKGVQVFILAGQSNMVGHGKADDGHGDVNLAASFSAGASIVADPTSYDWAGARFMQPGFQRDFLIKAGKLSVGAQ